MNGLVIRWRCQGDGDWSVIVSRGECIVFANYYYHIQSAYNNFLFDLKGKDII